MDSEVWLSPIARMLPFDMHVLWQSSGLIAPIIAMVVTGHLTTLILPLNNDRCLRTTLASSSRGKEMRTGTCSTLTSLNMAVSFENFISRTAAMSSFVAFALLLLPNPSTSLRPPSKVLVAPPFPTDAFHAGRPCGPPPPPDVAAALRAKWREAPVSTPGMNCCAQCSALSMMKSLAARRRFAIMSTVMSKFLSISNTGCSNGLEEVDGESKADDSLFDPLLPPILRWLSLVERSRTTFTLPPASPPPFVTDIVISPSCTDELAWLADMREAFACTS
mmetsp:Transcript_39891/g.102769  ORF Transcript_39891/g.102769 Transcript_39891/m.102769 type:complete len:277 (+) Transcript_39891:3611-4441(+)